MDVAQLVFKPLHSMWHPVYDTCSNLKVMIGDVSIDQNFFVLKKSFYPAILEQSYRGR